MANNTFTFVGKLGIGKKSEKFNPYVEAESKGGWVSRKLIFNVKNPINFASCEIYGGYSKKNPVVYGFTKGKDGEKGVAVQIPFSERLDEKHVENMAEFKKFVIVLGKDVRNEFISEYDFAESLKTIIGLEMYKDATFKVVGNVVRSEYNGKFYTKYQPTRIYLIEEEEDKVPVSEGILEFHFGNDAITDEFEESKKIFLSGYTRDYDGSRKKDIGIPVKGLEIDFSGIEEKKASRAYKKYLEIFQNNNEDEEFNKIGLKVKIIKGTEEKPFDESMLDEEQLELIEMGLLDIEDVKKEMGFGFGPKVEAIKVVGLARGYSKGAKSASLYLDDYLLEDADVFDGEDNESNDDENDEDFDLDLDFNF